MSERLADAAPVLVGCALLLATCALFTHVSRWSAGIDHDIGFYSDYGNRILDGQVPYRDVPIEYPPAALPTFIIPAAGNATGVSFERRFEWLMAFCGAGLIAVAGATLRTLAVSRRDRLLLLAAVGVAPLLLGSVAFNRFDLWPALLTSASILCYLRSRPRPGGALLGLATAAKIYPAALAPVLLADVWRRRGRAEALRSLAAGAAVFAACFAPFLAVAPHATLRTFSIQLHRPLEIESLGAILLIAAHHLGLLSVGVVKSYGSVNIASGRAESVAAAATSAVELAALAWVWLVCVRGRLSPSQIATGVAAVVTVLVAFGKVFSPQFMLWLVPLVPLVRRGAGAAATAVFTAALVLTQVEFDYGYAHLESLGWSIWPLLARNLLLVVLAGLLVRAVRAQRVAGGSQTSSPSLRTSR